MSGSRIRLHSSRSVRPAGCGTVARGRRGRRPSLLSARSVVGQMLLLMVSELVTNALRHGTQPVRLRLLLDDSLICEVADGSSTSPHLRRARLTDEGGRGLYLVARFARRWGTRYTSRRVIWAEQPLDQPAEGPETDVADALPAQWEALRAPVGKHSRRTAAARAQRRPCRRLPWPGARRTLDTWAR
ncbi:hypothetical protein GCM10018787_53420 [Streptomyces thermodiastaticus]|nr:hypothetical protein GCM10018787_53420 [Streptomyces thermodiastaticus]